MSRTNFIEKFNYSKLKYKISYDILSEDINVIIKNGPLKDQILVIDGNTINFDEVEDFVNYNAVLKDTTCGSGYMKTLLQKSGDKIVLDILHQAVKMAQKDIKEHSHCSNMCGCKCEKNEKVVETSCETLDGFNCGGECVGLCKSCHYDQSSDF